MGSVLGFRTACLPPQPLYSDTALRLEAADRTREGTGFPLKGSAGSLLTLPHTCQDRTPALEEVPSVSGHPLGVCQEQAIEGHHDSPQHPPQSRWGHLTRGALPVGSARGHRAHRAPKRGRQWQRRPPKANLLPTGTVWPSGSAQKILRSFFMPPRHLSRAERQPASWGPL